MGFFSEDMAPMLGVYEAETSELMDTLNAIAARVEREQAFSDEDIAELFRCAHTVKGSSAMMGLDKLASFTHCVEDLFDLLRSDPTLAEGRVSDILDHLYAFSDYVTDEVARMEDEDYTPGEADRLIDAVTSYVSELAAGSTSSEREGGKTGAGDPAKAAATTLVSAEPTSAKTVDATQAANTEASDDSPNAAGAVLRISFKPDVPMVNARALVIVRQLTAQMKVHSHVPEDLTSAESAATISSDGLLVVLGPADVQKARQFLAKNSFIRRINTLDEAVPSPVAKTGEQPVPTGEGAAADDKFITLRWSNIHELQDMAGEFLLHVSHLRALAASLPEQTGLRAAVSHTSRLVDELVYHIDRMAMVGMSAMIPQLSRMVRDMCRSSGKQVGFEVHGGDIEIDRNLYNSIADPLLHIIRNAVDHGIESVEDRLAAGKDARGKVTLSIENLGSRVAFRVADDGRGIDTEQVLAKAQASGKLKKPAASYTRSEILHMVMLAGLSTKQEITQYSGRGVGMDVVNAVVRDFNGRVEIESESGRGTSMTLFMPVSVTSVHCLCFMIGHSTYHIPLNNLSKIFTGTEAKELLSTFEGSRLFEFNKRQIPVLDMHRLFGCEGEESFYLVCHSLDDEFVIGVDNVAGDSSCANKPLPSCLDQTWQDMCCIRNVAIMDDGSVGFLFNAAMLADFAQGRKPLPEPFERPDDVAFLAPSGASALPSMPSGAFIFTLGNDWYALPVEQVERLAPMPSCARTPRKLPYLRGLTNYRNRAVAVFDLARSAGITEDSPYMLIARDASGENVGLTITSAIGVRDFDGAVPLDEQPGPRSFVCGLHTTLTVKADLKEPPITVLTR